MDDAAVPNIDQYRFLIVDDEQFSRSLIERMLRVLGCTKISLASDGGEAFKILLDASQPIDCVLTDINMSPVNGLELLKVIRIGYGDIDRAMPVISFSGLVDMELVPPAIQLDINGFLAKPVAKDLLVDAIKHALESENVVQTPDVYRRVDIPAASDLKAIALKLGLTPTLPQLTTSEPDSDDEQDKPDLSDNVDEIKEVVLAKHYAGYVLAKDIVSENDILLLAAGILLTERSIRHIMDLQKMDPTLAPTVFVTQKTKQPE